MRRGAVCALGLVVMLAGCRHRAAKAVAVAAAPPEIGPVMVSVPPPTHPTEPLPGPEVPVVTAKVPVPAPPKKVRKKRPAPVVAAPAPPVQVATATPPVIALGQLSAGDDAGKALRTETEQAVAAQKQRLDKLPTPVVTAHVAEVDQVRRFLKSAEDAWKTGDVEGARTLAVKARVMLDDLQK